MFADIDSVIRDFAAQKYVCNRRIATVVYLADRLEKPVLIEGPAGVGKTELARSWRRRSTSKLIRLQCYEGPTKPKRCTSGSTRSSSSTRRS